MNIRLAIGSRVRAMRIMRGLALEELSRELGISRQALSSMELGYSNIPAERIVSIAEYLDCDIVELFPRAKGNISQLSAEDARNLGIIVKLPPHILKTLRKLGADILNNQGRYKFK